MEREGCVMNSTSSELWCGKEGGRVREKARQSPRTNSQEEC